MNYLNIVKMKTQIQSYFKIMLTTMMVIIVGMTFAQTKGNGNVKTEKRNTADFTGIKLLCSADLYIHQGSTSVEVKADENILKFIKTTVNDGVLEINVKNRSFRSATVLEVHVSLSNLEMLKSLGSGDIKFVDTFKAHDLLVNMSGSGDLEADFDVTNLELKVNGSGDTELSGIGGTFKISVSGSGDLDAEELKLEDCFVKNNGSGDIALSGKTNSLTVTAAGSGDIDSYNLTAVNATINNSGSADITLNIVEELKIRLNGSGDVTYRGNPTKVDVSSRGSGEVYKK